MNFKLKAQYNMSYSLCLNDLLSTRYRAEIKINSEFLTIRANISSKYYGYEFCAAKTKDH